MKESYYDTIYVSTIDTNKLNPKLAYIKLSVNKHIQAEPNNIMALHNSGCAISIMNTQTFMQLKENGKTEMITQNEPIYISSCTGTKTPCRGIAYLFLQFKGVNDTLMMIKHKVIIHDTLDYKFLLGYEFTGSQYKVYETNSHIVFSSLLIFSSSAINEGVLELILKIVAFMYVTLTGTIGSLVSWCVMCPMYVC